jgi:hypothetical protein
MSLASVTSVAKVAEDDRIRRTYEVEDLDATFALAVGRRMRMAGKGFWTLCSETFALEYGATSVFFEVGVSIAFVLPLTVLCTWVTVTHGYTFGWEIYAFISFLLAFLLIFRLQTAHARYWEARTILAESKTAIISCGLLAVTQYHRHYGDPSDEVKLCVEGVHRYLCLYYFTVVNHLRFGDNGDCRQPNIEHYVTEPELELLRKKRGVLAPIKVVKWIGAQLCHMESTAAWSKRRPARPPPPPPPPPPGLAGVRERFSERWKGGLARNTKQPKQAGSTRLAWAVLCGGDSALFCIVHSSCPNRNHARPSPPPPNSKFYTVLGTERKKGTKSLAGDLELGLFRFWCFLGLGFFVGVGLLKPASLSLGGRKGLFACNFERPQVKPGSLDFPFRNSQCMPRLWHPVACGV